MADYETSEILMVNLLTKQIQGEDVLTQGFQKIVADRKPYFEKMGKKINYEHFDFHKNQKKGGAGLLDLYVRDILRKLYLKDIGLFSEKFTIYRNNGVM